MEQIIFESISKKYNGKWVLHEINNAFHQGESVAFIGHNGCGKSTLLKIIAGLVAPTSGKVQYNRPLQFSYVPEKFPPVNLSARSFLKRMCEIDGINSSQITETIEKWGEEFFLFDMLDIPMKTMSKGTLQKIGVIQAMIKQPDVLLLDEPLSGQDMDSQKVFIEKVNELRSSGVSVFMSCHETHLVKALSEKALTVCKGKLVPYEPKDTVLYTILIENKCERPVMDGMRKYGAGYQLLVDEEEMQKVVLQLMQDGWLLKGVYEEND